MADDEVRLLERAARAEDQESVDRLRRALERAGRPPEVVLGALARVGVPIVGAIVKPGLKTMHLLDGDGDTRWVIARLRPLEDHERRAGWSERACLVTLLRLHKTRKAVVRGRATFVVEPGREWLDTLEYWPDHDRAWRDTTLALLQARAAYFEHRDDAARVYRDSVPLTRSSSTSELLEGLQGLLVRLGLGAVRATKTPGRLYNGFVTLKLPPGGEEPCHPGHATPRREAERQLERLVTSYYPDLSDRSYSQTSYYPDLSDLSYSQSDHFDYVLRVE